MNPYSLNTDICPKSKITKMPNSALAQARCAYMHAFLEEVPYSLSFSFSYYGHVHFLFANENCSQYTASCFGDVSKAIQGDFN